MKFFDDMTDKFGFQDGSAIPEGVNLYRHVYIRCLNALLLKHKSGIRLVAYNRPGFHNPWLIRRTTAEWYESLSPAEILSGSAVIPNAQPECDKAYDKAVEEAREAGLDQFVVIEFRLDTKQLDQFLKGSAT